MPVEDHGADISVVRASRVAAALVTPAHQYPTGVTLSADRRMQLRWAREHQRYVIEDDYDGEFRPHRRSTSWPSPICCQTTTSTGTFGKYSEMGAA